MDDFQDMRIQGMIAVLVARPLEMAQWFSKTYFRGDYSMSQRASILTTLSIGAREIAGFGEEDKELTGLMSLTQFPTKKLPHKYHKIYSLEAAPINSLVQKVGRSMIRPLAPNAADSLAGPNALKVRTFSSRMEVEKQRKKITSSNLQKIIAEGFFFPLANIWRVQSQVQ